LRVIVAEMQRGSFWDKVKAALTGPKKEEVKWLGLLLNALTHFASAGSYDLKLDDFTAETPLKEAAAFFDYFDESLTRLLASWVGGKIVGKAEIDEARGVMVVFIDDLDRCLPAKTVQVLEAIKLFLDKPGCVFVLGADTDVVRDAVASHYQDMRITGQNADDYLDKVIQLRFQFPPIVDAEMGRFLDGEQAVIDDEVRRNWRTIVTGAEINPRKVKRFVNDVNLQWAMLANSGQARGVNRDDFTRWQVLRSSASPAFMDQVEDLPPDLRRKFIDDALKWARGEESVAGSFKAYEGERRLRKVLKVIEFSEQLTAEVLDAFVHLTAPPQPPQPTMLIQESVVEKGFMRTVIEAPYPPHEGGMAPGTTGKSIFGGVEFVRVPAGKFIMGSKDDNTLAYHDEKPQHTVEIPYDYWMARFPMTNDRFAEFIQATQFVTTAEKEGGWSPDKKEYVKGFDWRHPFGPKSSIKDKGNRPVVQVSWYDAMEYCKWLSEKLKAEIGDEEIRLPTEAEWEKSARGEYGNEWPWGNEFDPTKCNSIEGGKGGTTPVGTYSPQGDSPYGASDIVGNVWEWTQSLWGKDSRRPDFKYPYNPKDGREDVNAEGEVFRVVRGGSFLYDHRRVRAAYRGRNIPGDRLHSRGFRLVVAPRLA
jgi:formylglycine-generating enzyme required for sulfatase activity